jgi:hypothetical protein
MGTPFLTQQMETAEAKIIRLEAQVAQLKADVEALTKAGNRMSIRTGQFVCSKHYQTELKDWAAITTDIQNRA